MHDPNPDNRRIELFNSYLENTTEALTEVVNEELDTDYNPDYIEIIYKLDMDVEEIVNREFETWMQGGE